MVTIVKTRNIGSSKYFNIEEVTLDFDGRVVLYERLGKDEHRSVLVVPFLSHDRYLQVSEYAVGCEEYLLSVPMGGVEQDETLEDAARRELLEETGYEAGQITVLGNIGTVPALMPHSIDIVIATRLRKISYFSGDEPEAPGVNTAYFESLFHEVMTGQIRDSRAISAIYLAHEYLSANPDLLV